MWHHIWMLCWHLVVWMDRWRWFSWIVHCLSTSWLTCWVRKCISSILFNIFSNLFGATVLLSLDFCLNISDLALDNWSSWLVENISSNILESSVNWVTSIVHHHTWHVFIVGGVFGWEITILLVLVFKFSHVIDISESWGFVHVTGTHSNHRWVRNSIHVAITFICVIHVVTLLFITTHTTICSTISFSASRSEEALKEWFFSSNTILDIIDYTRHSIDQTSWSICFIFTDHSIFNSIGLHCLPLYYIKHGLVYQINLITYVWWW